MSEKYEAGKWKCQKPDCHDPLLHGHSQASLLDELAALRQENEHLKAETRRYQAWAKKAERERDEAKEYADETHARFEYQSERISALTKAMESAGIVSQAEGLMRHQQEIKLLTEKWTAAESRAEALWEVLKELRDAVKASGKMNGREYDDLGSKVNAALAAHKAGASTPRPSALEEARREVLESGRKLEEIDRKIAAQKDKDVGDDDLAEDFKLMLVGHIMALSRLRSAEEGA